MDYEENTDAPRDEGVPVPDTQPMQVDEFKSLRGRVREIFLRDVPLGQLLEDLLAHLAHSHGINPAQVAEDERAKEQAASEEAKASEEKAQAETQAQAEARNATPAPAPVVQEHEAPASAPEEEGEN